MISDGTQKMLTYNGPADGIETLISRGYYRTGAARTASGGTWDADDNEDDDSGDGTEARMKSS